MPLPMIPISPMTFESTIRRIVTAAVSHPLHVSSPKMLPAAASPSR